MPPGRLTFELSGVTKRFGDATALGPLTLGIEEGRTTVLLGPSGSGKSTLLRLLLGLLRADSGTVTFEGRPLLDEDLGALRRRLGFVVQGGGLFPHLTARGNVELLARHLGWDEPRRRSRIEALAALTQLPLDALERYPAQLSGGQRQRVSLMRALMLDPAVLLLDEPLGALDPITRHELQEDLRRIFEDLRRTVVLVTHDLGEAAFFAHRVVLLRDGLIVQEGTVDALLDAPADPFVTRFVNAQRSPLEGRGARR